MDTNRLQEFNMWYHTLNCGFRVRASGETDFPCISGQRVGMGRVYVKANGRLNYEDWCEGIREGRSYVSDGTSHLMEFAAHPAANAKLDRAGRLSRQRIEARPTGDGAILGESRRADWTARKFRSK